jgi:hypothetical protein
MYAHDPDDLVRFFGGVRKAQIALNLRSRQSIYHWRRAGKVPEVRARRAEEISGGRLKFDRSKYQ